MEVNQIPGVRFISTASYMPNLDAKIIAFYTILTFALSIMLSFKQSRCMLINNYTTYPLIKVKKCFKCLKRTPNKNDLKEVTYASYFSVYSYSDYTKYLKLKSLKRLTIATLRTGTQVLSSMNKSRRGGWKKNGNSNELIANGKLSASCLHRKIKLTDHRNCEGCHKLKYSNEAFTATMPVFPVSEMNDGGRSMLHRSNSMPQIMVGKYNSKISLYRKLPLKSLSRAWGNVNSIDLPVVCRKPCFYLYGWMFSCNFEEIDIGDLNEFKNLSEFFRRTLKPDARIIDTECCLVNPCDGRILNFGKSEKGLLEQVKGVNYSLKGFLGPQDWPTNKKVQFTLNEGLPASHLMDNDQFYENNILYNPEENCLYHCVIYLAPGDYHRFHSPTDWNIHYRRHFPGELFSVNPSVARWLQGLFNFNERVVYYGDWKYGFFSYTAVGATNVGSIKVYMDEDLTTNNKALQKEGKYLDKNFMDTTSSGVGIKRGDDFGEFNLGSTIVMIFEAPKNFEFDTMPGEKVFLGNQLGSSSRSSYL